MASSFGFWYGPLVYPSRRVVAAGGGDGRSEWRLVVTRGSGAGNDVGNVVRNGAVVWFVV